MLSCETWAKWSGAAVVLGLIIEVALAVKHPPFDSFVGIWGSVIADSLVALGVFGELLFSAMGSKRQGELQRRSKLMVAELNVQASEATARAFEAQLALEKYTAPRRLSDSSKQRITSKIAEFRGQPYILSVADGGEPADFLIEINNALETAGWIRVPPVGSIVTSVESLGNVELNAMSGIGVRVPQQSTAELTQRAMVLGRAIRDEGYEPKVAIDQTIPDKTKVIRIMIGAKQ